MAIEGLPGAGKTTLIDWLKEAIGDVVVVPELVLCESVEPMRAFYVSNDLRKAQLCRATGRRLLDRYWASTAAYVLAEERWLGRILEAPAVVACLYGRAPSGPDAYVFLDPPRALDHAYAEDGRFGDPRFRRLLRHAYYDVFAFAAVPVLVAHDDSYSDVHSFVLHHLGLAESTMPRKHNTAEPVGHTAPTVTAASRSASPSGIQPCPLVMTRGRG